ncbi:MAG TPA: hypothetical protein VD970_10855 [Acetobacteraceae bacterium]|nr:hypothetical protein [Acetobacteraceae bacterium]
MATPKVGCHATIREKKLSNYAGFYGPIGKDETFVVDHIDNGRGRGCVYLRREQGSIIPVWRGDVKAFPRCDYCDEEGHTKKTATKANCRSVSETL